MVTLVGPGGVGKTRLALQAAVDLIDEFANGVYCAALDTVTEPGLVPHAAAVAVGLREATARSVEDDLIERLSGRRVLLLLDNCEHLVAACAALAYTLLRACPLTCVLATSREPLRVDGELVWRVPSLTVPEVRRGASPGCSMSESDAVQLFFERARAAQRDFRLTDGNSASVINICARLDGIPLAIELAAAQVPFLTPEQISVQLDDLFRLLTVGSRNAPPRQRTMRAAIDWSYELLSRPERQLLERLSVFAGGATLQAIQDVCTGDGTGFLDLISSLRELVAKSLVMAESNGRGSQRYRLLETVREYGRERLGEEAGIEAFNRRHADYFLRLGEQARSDLHFGPNQLARLEQLHDERSNFLAALRWLVQIGDAERGLRLGEAVWRFWRMRSPLGEAREWFQLLIALLNRPAPTRLRADALVGAGGLARDWGDLDAAQAMWEESHTIWRELGDQGRTGITVHNLATIAIRRGNYRTAQNLLEKAVAIGREQGDRRLVAHALDNLGWSLAEQSEYGAARKAHTEALAINLDGGDWLGASKSLSWLGQWAVDEGNLKAARSYAERALKLLEEQGGKSISIWSLTTLDLAMVAYQQGDFATGRAHLEEALVAAQARDDRRTIVRCLEGFAGAADIQGDASRSLRLAGAAAALRERIGYEARRTERERLARWLARSRVALGSAANDEWLEGYRMSFEDSISYALAMEEPPTRWHPATRESLTAREREIVALLAEGRTNREIAEARVIALSTAERHVANILGKLGLRSRAQVAIWALQHPSPP